MSQSLLDARPTVDIDKEGREVVSGIFYHHTAEIDTITWYNRDIPKSRARFVLFAVGLFFAVLLGLFLTALLVIDLQRMQQGIALSTTSLSITILFVSLCWIVVLGIIYYLISLLWQETITITDEGIDLAYSGPLSPRGKHIPEHSIWRISFEKFGNERDQESRYTLNIFHDTHRETLAYWLRTEDNYRLYQLLNKILQDRGWMVQQKSDYQSRR